MIIPNKNAVKEARKRREGKKVSRDKVTEDTKSQLRTAIKNVDDPDAKNTLENMFEILTGEEVDNNGQ